jgi:hypothetical protein
MSFSNVADNLEELLPGRGVQEQLASHGTCNDIPCRADTPVAHATMAARNNNSNSLCSGMGIEEISDGVSVYLLEYGARKRLFSHTRKFGETKDCFTWNVSDVHSHLNRHEE